MLFYLDTSIWLDIYEKRGKNGAHAKRLLESILSVGCVIVIADLHIKELKQLRYSKKEIHRLFHAAKENTIHMSTLREQRENAKRIATQRYIPFGDATHAVLAQNSGAILVTRDTHFKKIRDIVVSRTPEESCKLFF